MNGATDFERRVRLLVLAAQDQKEKWLKPVPNGTLVYHGTRHLRDAQSIEKKIKLIPPKNKSYYGKAFYVSFIRSEAEGFAEDGGYVVVFEVVDGSRLYRPPGSADGGGTKDDDFNPGVEKGHPDWWKQWWGERHKEWGGVGILQDQQDNRNHNSQQLKRGVDGIVYTLNSPCIAVYNPSILKFVKTYEVGQDAPND